MNRRGFLRGMASLVCAAPAIVTASSLMPVRGIILTPELSVDELVALLSARIDAATKVMEIELNRSLYSGRPYAGPPIIDAP